MKDPLTKRKAARMRARKQQIAKGLPLGVNAGVRRKYRLRLERLVLDMHAATEKELVRLFEEHGAVGFSQDAVAAYAQDASFSSGARRLLARLKRHIFRLFDHKAQSLAEQMVSATAKAGSASLHASLKELSGGLSLKTSAIPAPLKESLKAHIADNVSLIRNLGADHLQKIEGAVYRSIISGNGLQDLVPELMDIKGMTLKRARRIAHDQTRKASMSMHKERLKSTGVRKFEWQHTGGAMKPREYHQAPYPDGLNGGIFEIDKPPVIIKGSETRGLPGDLPG